MTIGPITTVASEISLDSNASGARERGIQRFIEQSEVSTTLTSDTTSLSSLVAQAMQAPDIQQPRVDALRAAISSGNYTIDTGEIATSMLKELG